MAYSVLVPFAWDEAKNIANKAKHGVSFEEASALFTSGTDYLELFDESSARAWPPSASALTSMLTKGGDDDRYPRTHR